MTTAFIGIDSIDFVSDSDAPVLQNRAPAASSVDQLANTNIYLEIIDVESGVNLSLTLIEINVDGAGWQDAYVSSAFVAPYSAGSSQGVVTDGYSFDINPTPDFGENKTIQVRVTAVDDVGNTLGPVIYQFQTIAPPYVSLNDPAPDDIDVAIDETIVVRVRDDGSGINQDSLLFKVDGVIAYDHDNGGFQTPSYDGTYSEISAGLEYEISLDTHPDFDDNVLVEAEVDVDDNAGANVNNVWTFLTFTSDPKVVSAASINSTKVRVFFDQAMENNSALSAVSNYTIAPISIEAVAVVVNSVIVPDDAEIKHVDLVVTEMTDGKTYQLTVATAGPAGTTGEYVASGFNVASYTGKGISPQILRIEATDPTHIKITFDESMLDNIDIRNASNYEFTGGLMALEVLSVVGNLVTLLTSTQTQGELYTLTVLNGTQHVAEIKAHAQATAVVNYSGEALAVITATIEVDGVLNYYDGAGTTECVATVEADGVVYSGVASAPGNVTVEADGVAYSGGVAEAVCTTQANGDATTSALAEGVCTTWAMGDILIGATALTACDVEADGEVLSSSTADATLSSIATGAIYTSAEAVTGVFTIEADGIILPGGLAEASAIVEADGAILSSSTSEGTSTTEADGEVYTSSTVQIVASIDVGGEIYTSATATGVATIDANGEVI